MQLLHILGISFLAGCIGAAFVWYAWGLAENAASVLKARRAKIAPQTPDEDMDLDETKTDVAAS